MRSGFIHFYRTERSRGTRRELRRSVLSFFLCLICLLFSACGSGRGATIGAGTESTDSANIAGTESAGSVRIADAGESGSAGGPSEADEDAEKTRQTGSLRIGFVVKENSHDHWIRMKQAVEDYCEKQKIDVIFLAGSDGTAASEQIERIDQLTAEDVDAMLVAPISDEMVHAALVRASEQDIPVFAVDTDTSFAGKTAYIGTDNYGAAKAGAIYAARQLGGSGDAVILRGTPGDSAHDERARGIADGLAQQGMHVLETCYSGAAVAKEDVRRALQTYPNLKLLITTEDDITWNAWQMLLAAGNTAVSLYGFDGEQRIADLAARDSQVLGTTAQFPERIGLAGVETAISYLAGGKTDPVVTVPYQVIGKDNAEDYCRRQFLEE